MPSTPLRARRYSSGARGSSRGSRNIWAARLFALLALVAACSAFAAPEAPLRVVGVDIIGEPDGLDVPYGALPPLPMPYSADAAGRVGRAIARFYAENGYPYCRIASSEARDGQDVVLSFRIDLDERVCNGPPVLLGIGGARAGMFLRDVRIAPGQLYSAADADETVRRLSARQYVSSAEALDPVIIEDGPPCCAADADSSGGCAATAVAVTPIRVAERRGAEAEGAMGYESGRGGRAGRWNGRLNLSLINMARRGETADILYSGTAAVQKLRLSGAVPWIFGLPLEAGASGGLEVEDGGYGYFGGEVWGAAEVGGGLWKCGAALKGSETVPPETSGSPYRFYGADLFLSLARRQWERHQTVWELEARTGSGAANRDKRYVRSNMEISAGIHRPVRGNWALALRAAASSLFTDEEYLPPAELYRVGGHNLMRGYSEEEFAFRAVMFAQAEALYYFQQRGAVFIFIDGGAGFTDRFEALRLPSAHEMLGYGLGLRFSSGLGAVSLAWARNIDDGGSLGRVHVGIRTFVK